MSAAGLRYAGCGRPESRQADRSAQERDHDSERQHAVQQRVAVLYPDRAFLHAANMLRVRLRLGENRCCRPGVRLFIGCQRGRWRKRPLVRTDLQLQSGLRRERHLHGERRLPRNRLSGGMVRDCPAYPPNRSRAFASARYNAWPVRTKPSRVVSSGAIGCTRTGGASDPAFGKPRR